MGVTYRAHMYRRDVGQIIEHLAVFEAANGRAHRLLATSNGDGTYDIWKAVDLIIGPSRIVLYNEIKRRTPDNGSVYLI